MRNSIQLFTFIGFIKGFSAAALESQYFDEYINLSKYVEKIHILSAEVSNVPIIPSNIEIIKAPVSTIPKIRGFSKMFFYTIFPLKYRKKINLIYVRTMSPPEIQSFWVSKLFFKTKCVLLIGGTCFYEPLNLKNRFYRWLFSKALDSADKIVVYSKLMIPFVKEVNPKILDTKFEIIHNAVDPMRFHPVKKDEQLFKEIGLQNSDRVIIFVGKINERKGVIDILQMMPLLKEDNAKCIFIGNYDSKSNEFKKIQHKIKELNLSSKVFFLGKIPNNALEKYFSCAEIVVYLTKSCEGIPRAILEGMACGKPIIATPIAGIPDAVINNETGFLVKNFSDAAIKTDELFSNSDLFTKISKNCRKKIEQEFIYDVTLPKLVKVFQKVLDD